MMDDILREILLDAIADEASMNLGAYLAAGGAVHSTKDCDETKALGGPKNCVIHNPSANHPLTGSPQVLRSSGLIEDTCPHGVGHPNPDSLAYFVWYDPRQGKYLGFHGCDGCCREDDAK